jgi:hypothetical protein
MPATGTGCCCPQIFGEAKHANITELNVIDSMRIHTVLGSAALVSLFDVEPAAPVGGMLRPFSGVSFNEEVRP